MGCLAKVAQRKKVNNLKNQGVYVKESNYIAAENCWESSFQEGLSWRDGRRIVKLRVLAQALGKCCGKVVGC